MDSNIEILSKKINIFKEKYYLYKEKNTINEIELQEIICDILTWIEISIKRINGLNDDEKEIISAIKYANNLKKHSLSFFKYELKTYALYPSANLFPSNNLYPSDFKIYWNELPLENEKYKNQYGKYNKHLKGREIIYTVDEIFNIINKK